MPLPKQPQDFNPDIFTTNENGVVSIPIASGIVAGIIKIGQGLAVNDNDELISNAHLNLLPAISGETYTVQPNTSIEAAFTTGTSGGTITFNLQSGEQFNDVVVIRQIVNVSGNTVVLNSTDGFVVTFSDGSQSHDSQVTIGHSRFTTLRWGGSRWWLYNGEY